MDIVIPINFKIKIHPPFSNWLLWLVLFYRLKRYGFTFRRIPLSRGQYAIVDVEDYGRLSGYKWYAVPKRDTFYAKRYDRETGRQMGMHQQIIQPPDGRVVDHDNHNGLDNRRANLRVATPAQNACNSRKMLKPCSSKYKGVCWDNDYNQWRAYITHHGKRMYLGRFDNEEDAARAYDQAAKKYFGEFASLNFS